MMKDNVVKTDYRLHTSPGYRMSRLSKLIQTRLESRLSELGVSRIKWCVLASIGLQEVNTSSDLAEYIGITRQATSRVLVKMRKEKLIDQILDELDGRSRLLELTPAGTELLNKCLPIVEENQQHFFSKLTSVQFADLRQSIELMLEGEGALVDSL